MTLTPYYLRIAAEEAWAPAELLSRYRELLKSKPQSWDPGFRSLWGFFLGGTPRPIVDKLAGWFNQIVTSEETKQFHAKFAIDPLPGTPESMAALLKGEVERWGEFVKLANIKPQ